LVSWLELDEITNDVCSLGEDGPKQVANERKRNLSNSHLDIAREKHNYKSLNPEKDKAVVSLLNSLTHFNKWIKKSYLNTTNGASATLFDMGITNLGFSKLGILTPTDNLQIG